MIKWEYKVFGVNSIISAKEDFKLEKKLNEFGEEGWELVGILDQVDSGFGYQPRVDCNLILFKRQNQ